MILFSVYDEEAQTYHLLDVEFLLIREHEIRQRVVGHLLEDFPAFYGPRGHMIGRKLLPMQHLEGLPSQILPQHLVHCGFAHTGCGGQGSAASVRVSSQLFPRVFEELRGADTPFSSAPGRSRVFLISWNFLAIFHIVERFIASRLVISALLFPLLWSLITAFRSTAIVKLIFEKFGIPSLKVEIVSFQMVIILRKLTTLKGLYRKTKISCLNSGTPCSLVDEKVNGPTGCLASSVERYYIIARMQNI